MKKYSSIQDSFIEETDVFKWCNAIGIGLVGTEGKEIGLRISFETQEKLDSFPYKEPSYKGLPLQKEVVGKIVAQSTKLKR